MRWYVDTSVAIRALLRHSPSAVEWLAAVPAGALVSSRLLELEVYRVLRRERLELALADSFFGGITFLNVDDDLIREASAIRPHIRSLDAIHLASAQRIGAAQVTVVTHDAQMARVADELGFPVCDPIERSDP